MSEHVALYRKWRPTSFADVVGEDHVTKVLAGEVAGDLVSHAYLFCGSRGTGKTTCAKIFAKAVNCENPRNGDPCGKCNACKSFASSLDIVEMDAASNNGVDKIRDVIDRVAFPPMEMKKRVYIIDEVHMLSTGAFNALLKTLEEPPAHVLFILATTELHKIPATILSRCKRFDFHRITPEAMMPRLKMIAAAENIGITDDALRLVATLATGAMRDALSLLELFVGRTDIDRETAAKTLGAVGNEALLSLFEAAAKEDTAAALAVVDDLYNASKDMGVLLGELAALYRNMLVMKFASASVSRLVEADPDVIACLRNNEDRFTKERLLFALETVDQAQNRLARNGLSPRLVVETAVVKLCDARLAVTHDALLARLAALEEKVETAAYAPRPAPAPASPAPAPAAAPAEPTAPAPAPEKPAAPQVPFEEREFTAFGEVLEALKKQDTACYAQLANARAYLTAPDTVTISALPFVSFFFGSIPRRMDLLTAVVSRVIGGRTRVVFRDEKEPTADGAPDLGNL